ncbi:hypothetical protein D3C86_1632960 [compost metagenome]
MAPPIFARENARKKACLLFRCAELYDHGPDHIDAERNDTWGAESGTFFLEDMLFDHSPTGAAKRYRPTGGQPASLIEQAHPGDLILFVESFALTSPHGNIGRQGFTQEASDFLLEAKFGGGVADVHRATLKVQSVS